MAGMTVFNFFANDFLGFGGGIQAFAACCGVGVVGHFQSFARRQAVVLAIGEVKIRQIVRIVMKGSSFTLGYINNGYTIELPIQI